MIFECIKCDKWGPAIKSCMRQAGGHWCSVCKVLLKQIPVEDV